MPQPPIKKTHVPANFIYPKLKAETYRFGSGILAGVPLREDGNWLDYLPPTEDQNIRGVESSACYVEAQQHTLATILEEQYGIKDSNYSARFNALLSDGTVFGGDPIKGAQSIRHDGLIPQDMMPFGSDISSWEDFHSWKGVNQKQCEVAGQKWLQQWKPQYDVVWERDENIENKYKKLLQALQYSPICASVTAWYEQNGIYVKPNGERDNHLIEIFCVDKQNRAHIFDTYAPYLKILEPNFNFDFGMRWSVSKLTQKENWACGLIHRTIGLFPLH